MYIKEKIFIEESKKRITNKDMFNTIIKELESKCDEYNKAAKILDYVVAAREDIPLISEKYYPDVIASISPGGSEGIYLDWGLQYKSETIRLGTFKTLYENVNGYIAMGQISGLLVWASNQYLMLNDGKIKDQEKGDI